MGGMSENKERAEMEAFLQTLNLHPFQLQWLGILFYNIPKYPTICR